MRRMLRCDFDWYTGQFRPKNGTDRRQLRGEISPLYARLKPWQVDRIAALLPELRIILTLRHPIERVWSQALFELGHLNRRDPQKLNSAEFLRQVERARSKLSSDYCRTIGIWSNAFGPEALHIGFFDQLQTDPQGYINGVLRHIGATTPWTLPQKFITEKVHATNTLIGNKRGIPEVVQWYIADRLFEPTQRLNQTLAGQVSSWVDEMQAIRGKTRLSWRIWTELNRMVLSVPERFAYEAYHVVLDARLWLRWRKFQKSQISACGSLPATESLQMAKRRQ